MIDVVGLLGDGRVAWRLNQDLFKDGIAVVLVREIYLKVRVAVCIAKICRNSSGEVNGSIFAFEGGYRCMGEWRLGCNCEAGS